MAVDIGSFDFAKVIQFMQASGFYDYLLPLLLIFAIVFSVLEKTKIFGEKGTNINILISLIAGFLLVVQTSIVQIINSFIPKVSLILIVILASLLVIALLSGKKAGIKGGTFALASIVVFGAIIYALISSVPGTNTLISQEDAYSILTLAIPLGVFGLAIYLLTRSRDETPRDKTLLQRIAEDLSGDKDE